MKQNILKSLLLSLVVVLGLGFFVPAVTYADEDLTSTEKAETEENKTNGGTSISLSPVSKILQISSNSEYEDHLTVSNDGDNDMKIEVYAAPYSYVYSEDEDAYKLGFNNENNFTQITRWITFRDKDGNYATKPTFNIDPHSTIDVYYKITTPENIPAGGQYAVIFAHTLTGTMSSSGIRTEASPGMVVYGRSTEGETVVKAEISDLTIKQTATEGTNVINKINASAKIKNTGNVDFSGSGKLTVDGVLGGAHYETPTNAGRISVIPEAELVVSDTWEETPSFGLFKVTWTVSAGGETQTIEQMVFINPVPFVIVTIILLTIIIVTIIIVVRKRKERRSRFAV